MKNKGGRPKGSKNQPTLFNLKGTKMETLKLSRECLRIVYGRAHGSGLSPQTVLEDLIMAGDYTMGQAYDNLSNFRKRIREKASERNNVVPVKSIDPVSEVEIDSAIADGGRVVASPNEQDGHNGVQAVQEGSDDVDEQRGYRPEDNPAFGSASELGDVIGTVGNMTTRTYLAQDDPPHYADPGPEYTDEEGNPIEPQEMHEAE